ncbi:MAG: hypothetical protein E7447_01570 [Ruminococcaceae bacterium]|nr:hypothetical protein [Oscillospiraceae bacterium]
MMVTIGIYMRRWQRKLRRWAVEPRVHAVLQGAVLLLAGFCGSAAGLGNHPQPVILGLLCAKTGVPAVLIAVGSYAGYGLFWGTQAVQGWLWTTLGLATALLLRPRLREKTVLLVAAVAGVIVAAGGLALQYYQGNSLPIPAYLLQIAMAAGSGAVFCVATTRREPVADWLVYGLGVLCLAQIMPLPYVGLGFLAAGMIGVYAPFPAVALAGLALDLAQITPVPITAVLCLAYFVRLIPGISPVFRHLAPGAVYMLVMWVCGVWDLMPLPGLAVGAVAAAMLPRQTTIPQRRGETGAAQVQLELAAAVLQQMEQLLSDTEEAPIDEQALIVRAADRACGNCTCRRSCREDPRQISPALLHRPLGNGSDLPVGCRKQGRLLSEMRRSQEQLRAIRADRDRQREYRAAVEQQYRFLGDYLQEVSDSLAQRREPAKPWYRPEIAASASGKNQTNGDRCLWFAGVGCRYYVLLCDGMGTGADAARDARKAADMLRRLLTAGYPASYALRSINSLCALQGQAGAVTLDLAELRLDTGKATLYKWGAAPSYVIAHGEPIKIGTATPPPGLSVTDGREIVERLSLRRGETLVLLSDGAGGEESLHRVWLDADEPAGSLADKILRSNRLPGADDATVAVVRLHHTAS